MLLLEISIFNNKITNKIQLNLKVFINSGLSKANKFLWKIKPTFIS